MKLPVRREVEEAFAALLALREEDQEAFLEREYADDPGLHADVQSLLRAHRAAGSYLEPRDTAATISHLLTVAASLAPPSNVGHYRILRLIGEGGMGVVYEAEQDHRGEL